MPFLTIFRHFCYFWFEFFQVVLNLFWGTFTKTGLTSLQIKIEKSARAHLKAKRWIFYKNQKNQKKIHNGGHKIHNGGKKHTKNHENNKKGDK